MCWKFVRGDLRLDAGEKRERTDWAEGEVGPQYSLFVCLCYFSCFSLPL